MLLPFAKEPIPDPSFPWADKQPFFKESSRALVGLSGESRLADANSPYFRVLAGGGATTLVQTGESGQKLFSNALLPLDGVRPAKPPKRPVFRPGVPCETQEPPDLNSTTGVGETTGDPGAARACRPSSARSATTAWRRCASTRATRARAARPWTRWWTRP